MDIIDFDYPYWHTVEDTIDKVSAEKAWKGLGVRSKSCWRSYDDPVSPSLKDVRLFGILF